MKRRARLKPSRKTGFTLFVVANIGLFCILSMAIWFMYPLYLKYQLLQTEKKNMKIEIEKNPSYVDANFQLPTPLNEEDVKNLELRLPNQMESLEVVSKVEQIIKDEHMILAKMQVSEQLDDLIVSHANVSFPSGLTPQSNSENQSKEKQEQLPEEKTIQLDSNEKERSQYSGSFVHSSFPLNKNLINQIQIDQHLNRYWMWLEVDATKNQVTKLLERIQQLDRIVEVTGWNYIWKDETKKERLQLLLSFYSFKARG